MKKEYEKPIVELVAFEVSDAIATCNTEPFDDSCLSIPPKEETDGSYTDVNNCKIEVYCYYTALNITANS